MGASQEPVASGAGAAGPPMPAAPPAHVAVTHGPAPADAFTAST